MLDTRPDPQMLLRLAPFHKTVTLVWLDSRFEELSMVGMISISFAITAQKNDISEIHIGNIIGLLL